MMLRAQQRGDRQTPQPQPREFVCGQRRHPDTLGRRVAPALKALTLQWQEPGPQPRATGKGQRPHAHAQEGGPSLRPPDSVFLEQQNTGKMNFPARPYSS